MSRSVFDKRHIIAWVICLLVVLWSVFICYNSYIRLFEGVVGFATALFYCFFYYCDWCPEPLFVNDLSNVDVTGFLPDNWEAFGKNIEIYFSAFFDSTNFVEFISESNLTITILTQIFMTLLLVGVVIWVIKAYILKPHQNNSTGADTKPLKRFKKFEQGPWRKLCAAVNSFATFFWMKGYYRIPIKILFFLNVNSVGALFSFIGYYFYLIASLNFLTLPLQLYKLSVDILVALRALPGIVWIIIAWLLFDHFTRRAGYDALNRHEHINQLFLRTRGVNKYITGPPRSGKTSLITDMQLSQAVIFREDALGLIMDISSEFPAFPWQVFRKFVDVNKQNGKLKSRAAFKKYLLKKRTIFEQDPRPDNIFGYDIDNYPIFFDNGLVIENIFDALFDYVGAYLVYTEMTLFIGIYSVRETSVLNDVGNFPIWDQDFFEKPSFDYEDGVYSHIADYDMFRPMKRKNDKSNVFGIIEYGIIGKPEIDKERGNALENQEMKKNDDECNPRNDGYEQGLMMIGHGCTVRYKCFYSGFFDSQRVTGWGSKGTQLADLISIEAVSEDKFALPFYWYREMIYSFVKRIYSSQTVKNWFNRGDNTLRKYIFDKICTSYMNYCKRIENTFGYVVKVLCVSRGDEKGTVERHMWFEARKKVFSGVYATDSFSEYWEAYNLKTNKAFSDIPTYSSLHPSLNEMASQQNSYLMDSFMGKNQRGKNKR